MVDLSVLVVVGVAAALQSPPTFLLPGGGLKFWWQFGACTRLRESVDFARTPVIGASAGALVAVCAWTGVDFHTAASRAVELCEEQGVWERGRLGLAGIWGPMIDEWLHDLLPEDAVQRCAQTQFVVFSAEIKQTDHSCRDKKF